MPSCSIATCKNSDRNTKGMGVIYHCIPTDPETRAQWLKYTTVPAAFNPFRHRVCSEHFDEDCYERDLKAELLNLPSKKRLKPSAVPTLKITYPTDECSVETIVGTSEGVSEASMNIKVEYGEMDTSNGTSSMSASPASFNMMNQCYENSVEYRDSLRATSNGTNTVSAAPILLLPVNHLEVNPDYGEMITPIPNGTSSTVSSSGLCNSQDPLLGYLDYIKNLKETLQKKTSEVSKLRTNLKKSKAQTRKLKKELCEIKRGKVKVKIQVKREIHKILGKCFTPGQIKRLLSETRVKWQPEDIMSALSICAVSLKAYVHIKDVIGIPLPGVTTLQKWVPVFKDTSDMSLVKDMMASEHPGLDIPSDDEEPQECTQVSEGTC